MGNGSGQEWGEPARHGDQAAGAPVRGVSPEGWPSQSAPQVWAPGQPGSSVSLWLGAMSVFLGLLGCTFPLAPIDLSGVRGYSALVCGSGGGVVGLMGCLRGRRGRALAITGLALSVVALALGVVIVGGSMLPSPQSGGARSTTESVLRDDLEVRFGDYHADPSSGDTSMTVTVLNKGRATATFAVTIQEANRFSGTTCEIAVTAMDLAPGASYRTEIHSCDQSTSLQDASLKVTRAAKR